MAADATIELHLPQDLLIGGGASDDLAEHVARIGIERPLVVSDRFLLDKGPAGPLVERLKAGGATVAVFGEVQPDPTLDNVEGALQALRDHEADGVVAIGGGSPMDTAKAAAGGLRQRGRRARLRRLQPGPGPGPPARGGPDDGRDRQRGHARGGHHRHRPRREDDDARRPPDGPRRDLRLQADA